MLSYKEYLKENPTLLSTDIDFKLSDDSFNSNYNKELLKSSKTKILETFDDFTDSKLYKSGNKIFLSDGFKIYYFVHYVEKYQPLLGEKAITQIKVWRSNSSGGISHLPSYVFYNYLLPITGVIITDIEQTDDGKRFWWDRIVQSLRNGDFVYFINLMSPKREVTRITSYKEFKELDQKYSIWAKASEYKLLAISNHELKNFKDI